MFDVCVYNKHILIYTFKRISILMSADIPSLLEQGFRPVYHRARRQWYVQRRIDGRLVQKYVPKRYEPLVKREYASLSEEHAKRLAEIEDARHIMSLRRAKLDEKKPLVAKEIECLAWFQHVVFDLGTITYLTLAGGIEWDELDARDAERAVGKLAQRLKSLLRLEKDAVHLERLEESLRRCIEEKRVLYQRLFNVERENNTLKLALSYLIGTLTRR